MLKEMEVIDAVCTYLDSKRPKYEISRRVNSVFERGTDILARSPRTMTRISVEAKGQTTSKQTSRKGTEFSPNQKEDHFGRALVKSCQAIQRGEVGAIALPSDEKDRELVESTRTALTRLAILVFLVSKDSKVRLEVGRLPP